MNRVYWENNTDCLKRLKKSGTKLDFVYIDPPFFSAADYKASINTGKEIIKTTAYSDKWENINDYLDMLQERLVLIKDVLKDSGLVAVHLDTHVVHYVKVMMDEIFGMDNFVNDIIWSYKSGGARAKGFAKKHDNILLYSKTKAYYFKVQKEKSYNREGKAYKFKGVDEYMDEKGLWYTLVNQKDVINVDMVGRTSKERTGYATQKPEKLLEILIESCCPENGICADFFCGSGGLGAVCSKTKREYILCDSSPVAIAMTRKRLMEIESTHRYFRDNDMTISPKINPQVLSEIKKYL